MNSLQQIFDLGIAHHQAGRLNEAETLYRQILAQQPDHPDALHLLGVIACQLGRNDVGAELIRQAMSQRPVWPDACNNLGKALLGCGRVDEAIQTFRCVIGLRPDAAECHFNLGIALAAKGHLAESAAAYRHAIRLRPDYADAWGNLGNALAGQGKFDEAIAAYRQSIALHPNWPEAYLNLGNALKDQGKLDEAASAYRQSIALRPAYPEAHNNLANVLSAAGRLDDAIAAFREAIALRPQFPEAYANLGNVLRDRGRYDESIAACRQAMAISSDHPSAHSNFALVLLLKGDYAQGWREFEWRWKSKELAASRPAFNRPQWDGSTLDDGTILLGAEQGFGDGLQFIRYVPLVAQRCRRVIVTCPPELRRLLKINLGPLLWTEQDGALPPYDAHCPLMTLPLLFGTTVETIPNAVPYVEADALEIERWRTRLGDDPAPLKVGLVWAGRPAHKNDRNRSLPYPILAPLAQVPGVSFYSLQKGEPAEQARKAGGQLKLIDWTKELNDFAGTAALVANLDLVICVDTALAHLAGAMGKPVWTLLPFVPDWRWLLDRSDSPWYPTMRLFRQQRVGDWEGVIETVVAEIRALALEKDCSRRR